MDKGRAKIRYQQFCQSESLPTFFQPWWLDAVCGQGEWQVVLSEDGAGNIIGAMPWYTTQYRGIRIHRMPPLTPYLGPWLVYPQEQKRERYYAFEKKVLNDLISQLPPVLFQMHHCHPRLTNWLPFHWAGYRQTTRYTYLLDGISDTEETFANFNAGLRNEIRKGEKKFRFRKTENLEEIYGLVVASFRRRKLKPPFDLAFLQKLDQAVLDHSQRLILLAAGDNDQPAAGTYLIRDATAAYCLLIGVAGDKPETGAVPAVLWQAIQAVSGQVDRFDFEGSMIPGVEHLFSGFGGALTPYFQLRKSANPIIELISLWRGI